MALRHWLQLALTDGIGPILGRRLIEAAGSAQAACAVGIDILSTVEGIGTAKARKIAASMRDAGRQVDDELARCAAANISVVCPDDQTYPLLLRTIPDPPNVLYIRGTLEPRDLHAVAIVGSRNAAFTAASRPSASPPCWPARASPSSAGARAASIPRLIAARCPTCMAARWRSWAAASTRPTRRKTPGCLTRLPSAARS